MTQYKHKAAAAAHFNKHGVDLTVYGQADPAVTTVHIRVAEGHFQEFCNVKSSYTIYVIGGHGVFYLNDEAVEVNETDLVVVPPGTRIYYFGSMELLLTISPAWDEANERHVRFLEKNQIPNTPRP